MRKPKNRIIGNCDWCGKELLAFGTPFVVEEHEVIYKKFFCHTIKPETNCLYKHWAKKKAEFVKDGPGGLDQN